MTGSRGEYVAVTFSKAIWVVYKAASSPGHYHQTLRLKPNYPRLRGTSLTGGCGCFQMDGHRGGSRTELPTGVAEMEGEGFGDTKSKLLDGVFTRGGGCI